MKTVTKKTKSNAFYTLLSVVFSWLKNPFIKKQKISENIYCIKYKEIPFWIPGRKMGNTTRLIDSFVQDFFISGKCEVRDHYASRESNKRVMQLVLLRLKNEHNINEEELVLDRNRLIITSLNYR